MAKKQIAILGAGISGLATAHRLLQLEQQQEDDYDITLFDSSGRIGGVIRTETRDGRILEWGPENFVAFKPTLLQMIRELGIEDRVIGSNDSFRRTFVASGGRLNTLPEGMSFLAPVSFRALWGSRYLSTLGKLRVCLEPLIRPNGGDPTVAEFTRRRLGPEMCEKVVDPLVSAIFGGDTRKLSMLAALPDSYHMAEEWGSLWRGMRHRSRGPRSPQKQSDVPRSFFLSLKGGMRELVDALDKSLIPRLHLALEQTGVQVRRRGDHLVVGNDRFEAPFDAVVVATPATATAHIVQPLSPQLSGELAAVPYGSVSLIYLAYSRKDFAHPLDGFGFVTAADDAEVLDACTFVSSKFKGRCPENEVLLRCAVHDGRFQRKWDSDQDLVDRVQGELGRLLKVSTSPHFVSARSLSRAMPQPGPGHILRLKRIKEDLLKHPGLYLCGAYSGGVGLPDSSATGRKTAVEVAEYLKETNRTVVGGIAHRWAISPSLVDSERPIGSETR